MSMTRKEFLTGAAGCSLCSLGALGSPVKSMLGSKVVGDEVVDFDNPYVSEGLIAMWDGEWNAGWGIHDDNAIIWKDLIGNRDAALSGTYSWGDNYWDVQSVSGKGLATWDGSNLPHDQTIEILIFPSAAVAWGRMMAEGQDVPAPIIDGRTSYVLWLTAYGIDKGFAMDKTISNLDFHLHSIVHPSGGQMTYYLDGSPMWTNASAMDSTGKPIAYFANRADFQRGIDARYYCVRIYSRAITEDEIRYNYNIDKERFGL